MIYTLGASMLPPNLEQDLRRQQLEKMLIDKNLLELSHHLGEPLPQIEQKFRQWIQTQPFSAVEGSAQLKLKAMVGWPMPWEIA